jgi:hypothetical protein
VHALNTAEYGVVIIDSITHLWEAARAAYDGRQTKIGTIPMQAWGKIKKPYKDLMAFLLSSPMHVIICGRQGVEYETDEETDELKAVGVKMKAEGETPYEPHILIRMEAIKPKKTNEIATIIAYAEKDRTGVLSGRSFQSDVRDALRAAHGPARRQAGAHGNRRRVGHNRRRGARQAGREREAESAKPARALKRASTSPMKDAAAEGDRQGNHAAAEGADAARPTERRRSSRGSQRSSITPSWTRNLRHGKRRPKWCRRSGTATRLAGTQRDRDPHGDADPRARSHQGDATD